MTEKEDELFSEWSEMRTLFSPDGVIDALAYMASKPKVLFLLKEINSIDNFDLRPFVKSGGRPQTWDNIARWIYGIKNIEREIPWTELEKINTSETRMEMLRSIIVMNLKKSSGKHTTVNNELWSIANEDKKFINRQFQIYFNDCALRPDIIIACGSVTSNFFNELVEVPNASEWKISSKGINYYEYDNGRFFIKYAHPEARIQDCILCYPLIDVIKELTRK